MSFQNKLFESDFYLDRNNLVTDNSMFLEDYKDCECIVFAMGCFGVQRGSFGQRMESFRLPLVTQEGTQIIRLIKMFALE